MKDQMVRILLSLLALFFFTETVSAAETRQQALNEITETADKICGSFFTSGRSTSLQVQGEVKGELAGLIKRLTDLGVIAKGEFSESNYEGVLQNELGAVLKDIRTCKLDVLKLLEKKFLTAQPSTTPNQPPLPFYANDSRAPQQDIVVGQNNFFPAPQICRENPSLESEWVSNSLVRQTLSTMYKDPHVTNVQLSNDLNVAVGTIDYIMDVLTRRCLVFNDSQASNGERGYGLTREGRTLVVQQRIAF